MSLGDTISIVATVAAAAFLTYIPAVGVEVLIFDVSSDQWVGALPLGSPNATLFLKQGALNAAIADRQFNPTFWQDLKLYIDNTMYLYIQNRAGVNAQLSYVGIQTK